MSFNSRIVVLGIGNTLLTDEGVGVHALARLRADCSADQLSLVDGGTLGLALLEYVERADGLIVIDAARLGLVPGSVRRYGAAEIDGMLRSGIRTVHELGLKELLDMARLNGTMPPRRALIAVEPACIDWGTALSPAVEAALSAVGDLVIDTAAAWAREAA